MAKKKEKRILEIDLKKRKTLTLTEIEAVFGIPAETVRKWTKRDLRVDGYPKLESFKPGKDIMVYVEVFETYIKRFPVGA